MGCTTKERIKKNTIIPHTYMCKTIFKSVFEYTLKILFGYCIHITFVVAVSATSSQNFTPSTNSGCSPLSDPLCLKCNTDGCMKCPTLLIIDNRRCTETCPTGYSDQWSSNPEFMGRICLPQNVNSSTHAALTGVLAGFMLCLIFLIVSAVLIKRKKRRKTIKEMLMAENNIDRSDFLRQLDEIRPNSEYILAMLNDTRRQIRKLHLSGETAVANSYRSLVRDLAKLLILLNRPIELIPAPPHDWNRIHAWAERALEQYKPQVGHLIDFFQSDPGDPRFDTLNKHSTFRSTATTMTSLSNNHSTSIGNCTGNSTTGGSFSNQRDSFQSSNLKNSHQMQLFGSLISLHEFDEPKSSDPFGSSFNTLKGNLMTNSDLNASSLWLEDEFFKLGLRPQDEITTEL